MKKFIIILFIAVAMFSFTQRALADNVQTIGGSGFGPYQTGSGGEFTLRAYGSTLEGFVSLYSSNASNLVPGVGPTFQTFCLEEQEFIAGNTRYEAILNDKAIYGGVGKSGDPISIGTAYLYYLFATGNLTGYNYGTGRPTSASQLQQAFWYLEDEISLSHPNDNPFLHLVNGLFTNPKADNNGTYDVRVLNIYELGHAGDANYRRQDQLILDPPPVPEPITMLLLGLGLFGVAGIKRKLKS